MQYFLRVKMLLAHAISEHSFDIGNCSQLNVFCMPQTAQGASDKLSLAWLDHFLKEFYASRQPQEARMRVSRILEEFESAVIEHYKSSSQVCKCGGQ